MGTSCAMMASSVTPPTEDEGTVEVERAAVCVWGCLSLSCASLHRTVAVSMASITEKQGETRKGTERWRSIHMIVEGKMSLS